MGGTWSGSRFVSAAPTPQTGPMGGTLTNSRFVSK
jgi:hypothetical protein